jgi:hypothetical protein
MVFCLGCMDVFLLYNFFFCDDEETNENMEIKNTCKFT